MKKKLSILFLTVMFTLLFSVGVMANTQDTVIVPTKYYGNEAELTKSYTYTNNAVIDEYERGVIVPLKVNQPGTIKVVVNYARLEKDVIIELCSDKECTNVIGWGGSSSIGDVSDENYFSVTNAGIYYLKIYTGYTFNNSTFTNSFSLKMSEYTKSDKTIKSGQTITYYRHNANDVYWFKYKAENTGKVTVNVTKRYGSYITLANSKKKPLLEKEWVSDSDGNYQTSFMVKKGTTYYFGVTAIGDDSINTISVKNTAVKEKSGSTKKKAVSIKAKKKIKGIIAVGEKKADWYKFSLKKKKAVTFTLNGDIKGSLKFTVYNKKGKKIDSYTWSGGQRKLKLTYSTTYGKVKKGTYYVKISRADSKSSGSYTLKWK